MLTQTTIHGASARPMIARGTPAAPPVVLRAASSPIELMGVSMSFARNAEIYGESEPADYLYKVVSGTVRTYKVLNDGRRQISAFYFPGDIFGLETGDEHTFSAEAITDSKVLVILLLIKTAEERVVSFLLEMAARRPAANAVELPMSRQDIADYLGLTIETVSRTLSQLEDTAAIELPSSRHIVLRNRTALGRLNG